MIVLAVTGMAVTREGSVSGSDYGDSAFNNLKIAIAVSGSQPMCRNIRTLFNFEPPATEEEIRASALQFARKLGGFTHPSKVNEAAFNRAVDDFAQVARRFLDSLDTSQPPRDRAVEAMKAKARARRRFA
jgi:hypothetical protein